MLLTIAIPSHNGVKNICQTLDSIFMQTPDEILSKVKVLVCDNGSSSPLLQGISSNYLNRENLEIKTFDDNLGYDLNLLRMLQQCKSEYIWLLGDDDLILPNSIKLLFELLKNSKYSALLMMPIYEKSSLNYVLEQSNGREVQNGKDFFNEVFYDASLLSSLVFRTDKLPQIPSKLIGKNWVHVVILALICEEAELPFYRFTKPCVQRIDSDPQRWNDHFQSEFFSGLSHVLVLFYFRQLVEKETFLYFLDKRMPRPITFFKSFKYIRSSRYKVLVIYLFYKLGVIYRRKLLLKIFLLLKNH